VVITTGAKDADGSFGDAQRIEFTAQRLAIQRR
jgi:hypothetical protein